MTPADSEFSADHALCAECDYALLGLTADRCPECGTAIPRYEVQLTGHHWMGQGKGYVALFFIVTAAQGVNWMLSHDPLASAMMGTVAAMNLLTAILMLTRSPIAGHLALRRLHLRPDGFVYCSPFRRIQRHWTPRDEIRLVTSKHQVMLLIGRWPRAIGVKWSDPTRADFIYTSIEALLHKASAPNTIHYPRPRILRSTARFAG